MKSKPLGEPVTLHRSACRVGAECSAHGVLCGDQWSNKAHLTGVTANTAALLLCLQVSHLKCSSEPGQRAEALAHNSLYSYALIKAHCTTAWSLVQAVLRRGIFWLEALLYKV